MTRPTLRERMKPLELVGMAAVLGVFAGVIALIGTRSIELASILAGIAFIVALLVLAMLSLAAGDQRPDESDVPVLQREKPLKPKKPKQ